MTCDFITYNIITQTCRWVGQQPCGRDLGYSVWCCHDNRHRRHRSRHHCFTVINSCWCNMNIHDLLILIINMNIYDVDVFSSSLLITARQSMSTLTALARRLWFVRRSRNLHVSCRSPTCSDSFLSWSICVICRYCYGWYCLEEDRFDILASNFAIWRTITRFWVIGRLAPWWVP